MYAPERNASFDDQTKLTQLRDAAPDYLALLTSTAGCGTGFRTEVVWLNPSCHRALDRNVGSLFERVHGD